MFKDGDVICFFGDSITANGLWLAEVYQKIRKSTRVKCYNCGVPGVSAERAALYLDKRCLSLNPDFVVMMFGINDIKYSLYKRELIGDKETDALKKAALAAHKEAYEGLVKKTLASGAGVILCIPSPYDDQNVKAEEILECRAALDECADFQRFLAKKYGLPVVDFMTPMRSMLTKRDILSHDRIHPTPEGHHVMAEIFLKEMGYSDDLNFDAPFIFEEWNRERYRAEQELTRVNFIEYCVLLKEGYVQGMSCEERKRIAKERYDGYEDKTGFFPSSYRDYIEKIDRYLDNAILSGMHTVRLIHGKGTGALKRHLWEALRIDGRVASYRIGQWGEGDGGVTIVELK